jgi:flagellar motor switch protein FliM
MAEPLSQGDIDALLNTFAEEEKQKPESEASSTPDAAAGKYDFSHPDFLSRDQVRTLRTLFEGYAQALAKRLSTELLTNVSVSLVSVDHLTYAEFLMLVPTPTVLSVLEERQLDGNIALELNPTIAFTFIDRLLGGAGQPLAKIRPLTVIEQGLMERVLDKCIHELNVVWAPVMDLEFKFVAIEGNPELARVVEPNEMVLLISLELSLNDVTGTMNLCFPYIVMEPALNRLGVGTTYARARGRSCEAAREAITGSVRSCPVQVEVQMGATEVTLAELLDLQTGDVIRFEPASREGACAVVEGIPQLGGTAGRYRGRLAFRASKSYPQPSSEDEESQQ